MPAKYAVSFGCAVAAFVSMYGFLHYSNMVTAWLYAFLIASMSMGSIASLEANLGVIRLPHRADLMAGAAALLGLAIVTALIAFTGEVSVPYTRLHYRAIPAVQILALMATAATVIGFIFIASQYVNTSRDSY